jgi:hypothetical protein
MHKIATIILVAGLLSACGSEEKAGPSDDARTADGEVLGGTISDDMLPLDQLESQSPALEPVVTDATTTTTTETDEGTSTTVERSVSVTTGGPAAAAPEQPRVPVPPRQPPAADQ